MKSQSPKATSFKKAVIEASHDLSSHEFYGRINPKQMKEYHLMQQVLSYISYYALCVEKDEKPEYSIVELMNHES